MKKETEIGTDQVLDKKTTRSKKAKTYVLQSAEDSISVKDRIKYLT